MVHITSPDLLGRHLLKILIHQATIIIERVSRRLRGVRIRFDRRRLNLVLIRRHLIRAIRE